MHHSFNEQLRYGTWNFELRGAVEVTLISGEGGPYSLVGAVSGCPPPVQLSSEDSNAQRQLMSALSARRVPYHSVNKRSIPDVGSGHVLQCRRSSIPLSFSRLLSLVISGSCKALLCLSSQGQLREFRRMKCSSHLYILSQGHSWHQSPLLCFLKSPPSQRLSMWSWWGNSCLVPDLHHEHPNPPVSTLVIGHGYPIFPVALRIGQGVLRDAKINPHQHKSAVVRNIFPPSWIIKAPCLFLITCDNSPARKGIPFLLLVSLCKSPMCLRSL